MYCLTHTALLKSYARRTRLYRAAVRQMSQTELGWSEREHANSMLLECEIARARLDVHLRLHLCVNPHHRAFDITLTELGKVYKSPTLITMCAWTRRIRIGEQWLSVEEYLNQVHGLAVTHGICPEAVPGLLAARD
jgi:hypothetical protein